MNEVTVSGPFDDLHLGDMRRLQEVARNGPLRVLLWSDEAIRQTTGSESKFKIQERQYLLESLRFVAKVEVTGQTGEFDDSFVDLDHNVFPSPIDETSQPPAECNKVVVTGCYDWLHSGHVRFFEEASRLGNLYVVVGSDANVRLLKGEGHPLFSQEERKYQVECVRFVRQAMISSGTGWMDAATEIERIDPDIYVVNEDGDRPEKRAYCEERGLEYVVLKRRPKEGLPARESTALRGF